jgi:hypothetical protein
LNRELLRRALQLIPKAALPEPLSQAIGVQRMQQHPRTEGLLLARLIPKLEGSNPHQTGRSEKAGNLCS